MSRLEYLMAGLMMHLDQEHLKGCDGTDCDHGSLNKKNEEEQISNKNKEGEGDESHVEGREGKNSITSKH